MTCLACQAKNTAAMRDSRSGERTPVRYTMMAPARHPTSGNSLSHSHSQSTRSGKATKTTTPMASPWPPHSVGQSHPPKLSPAHPAEARAPSPNYFGLVVDSANDPRDSSGLARDNWSPSPSSIKSFAAAIPKQVPLDANPEFEAFKRQADLNRGKSISLSGQHAPSTISSSAARPRPPRWHTHASDTPSDAGFGRSLNPNHRERPASRMDVDQESLHDSAYVSAESKRNSESSLFQPQFTGMRFESPRPMEAMQQQRTTLTRAEDRDPRLSVMEHRADPPSPRPEDMTRPSTLPPKLETGKSPLVSVEELKDLMKNLGEKQLLLLDLRSSQNYSQSRIKGALNLCIPTTLLKRATFNIQKLQQTFQQGPDSQKFSQWQSMKAIVVYDAHSSDKREAVTAQNMVKKFTNEGFSGRIYILRGGFNLLQETCPSLVDHSSPAQSSNSPSKPSLSGALAPVIGGVNLPAASNGANPFFSNIRQNMDLADGVGQMDIARPQGLNSPALPDWLRKAASTPDHGKKVSDNFLHIELDEQARMKSAYAAFDPSKAEHKNKVQLCGIEKGGKNRYKDILPFEHARVKLQHAGEGSCDYINASHLKSSGSYKKYIASQGPLPATFEDFWSVIWEQDVRVIVMLTAETEGGQLKCHPYWKGREYGPIRLKPLSEKKASLDIDKHRTASMATPSVSSTAEIGRRRANTTTSLETPSPTSQSSQTQGETPFVIIRKFALSHAAHPFAPIREITHLHFPAWPDFGTPAQPSHLLALVELSNVMQRAALPVETPSIVGTRRNSITAHSFAWYDEPENDARTRPMLVHCSAGCGRTGTFCTVDTVIDMLKRQRQAKETGIPEQDNDGDVSMTDSDDGGFPFTNGESTPQRRLGRQRTGLEKRPSQGIASIDTSWLLNDKEDLILRTVNEFREQRLSMVQSLRQFVLCYESVLEWINRLNEHRVTGSNGRARSGSVQIGGRDC
ncbi:Tyrosine-protein phosphatase [Paramyrothecium foliicola]|nr:Tyrosine-protein phosphatase [Paramyrothecium foliicola]